MALVHSGMVVPEARRGGKLIEVPVPGGRGVSIKMYEDEARARGLLPPADKGTKKRTPSSNKKRTPEQSK